MKRPAAVAELKGVYSELKDDFTQAKAAVLSNPSAFHKRNLVRTTFALIDGFAFQLRQVTLATLDNTKLLTDGDLAILREERYQLSSKGLPEVKENYQKTLPMILFSLRVYAKNHGSDFVPDTSLNGWNCLKQAVEIRDRVTHPKSLTDLDISDEVGKVFAEGVRWWDDMLGQLLASCEEADNKFQAQMSARSG